jgi:hypothetical protein
MYPLRSTEGAIGNGSAEDKELVHRLYGIVNVGPPLKL